MRYKSNLITQKAKSSPFKMKYSGGKTPLMFNADPNIDPITGEKPKPKETKFIDTKEGRIAVERQTVIPGQKVEKLAQPGTPEYDKWKAAVEANPSIEDKYKDQIITEKRDVKMFNTPRSMQPGRNFFGLTISKDVGDKMSSQAIGNLYRKAKELNKNNKDMLDLIEMDFRRYLRENKYKRGKSKTKVGNWERIN